MKKMKKLALVATLPLLSTCVVQAQKLRVTDGTALVDGINKSATSGTSIALILTGCVIAIGLATTVYKVIHGTGSKEALIGWISGVILYGLAVTYVLTTT